MRHLEQSRKVVLSTTRCVPGPEIAISEIDNMGKQEFDARPSVIVVGAGAGGVATAARLAQAGCKVTLVEKNDFSGGRCSLIHRDGYVCCFMLKSSSRLTHR